MNFQPTRLPEVILLTPRRFGDARGWFTETWNKRTLAQGGIGADFVQDNHSMSAEVGTLRGLHYQAPPHAQDKLVRCTRGAIWDVAVDVRRGSPRYGQWVGVDLTAEGGAQLFVPKGSCTALSPVRPIARCSTSVPITMRRTPTGRSPGTVWALTGAEGCAGAVGQGPRGTGLWRLDHALCHGGCCVKILVTGGAGFIGSAVVRRAVGLGHAVVNVDALTYAACLENVASVAGSPLYSFEQADIRDRAALDRMLPPTSPTR